MHMHIYWIKPNILNRNLFFRIFNSCVYTGSVIMYSRINSSINLNITRFIMENNCSGFIPSCTENSIRLGNTSPEAMAVGNANLLVKSNHDLQDVWTFSMTLTFIYRAFRKYENNLKRLNIKGWFFWYMIIRQHLLPVFIV